MFDGRSDERPSPYGIDRTSVHRHKWLGPVPPEKRTMNAPLVLASRSNMQSAIPPFVPGSRLVESIIFSSTWIVRKNRLVFGIYADPDLQACLFAQRKA